MFGYLCEVNKKALKHLVVYPFFRLEAEHCDTETQRIFILKQIKCTDDL